MVTVGCNGARIMTMNGCNGVRTMTINSCNFVRTMTINRCNVVRSITMVTTRMNLRSEMHGNHRVYLLGSSRVTTSRHVRFEEDRFPLKGPGRGVEVPRMGEVVTSSRKERRYFNRDKNSTEQ